MLVDRDLGALFELIVFNRTKIACGTNATGPDREAEIRLHATAPEAENETSATGPDREAEIHLHATAPEAEIETSATGPDQEAVVRSIRSDNSTILGVRVRALEKFRLDAVGADAIGGEL